ncbi:MAG: tRNA 2-thiouridine(34) synthase MnmA, partial [Anaerolineae bacterium]|nr:tRNA 2-thiouridine(34) synthase MnmA [Anaerolineae bacterium]NIN94016.1 tRNA 2-thiouridine(34) synthase MnmA [Anaerolineae bacterium]
ANYTIGQRKGLGISAPQPLYVIEKQIVENALVVGPKEALGRREFIARRTTWVSGRKLEEPIRVSCRVRYKAPEVSSTVRPL